MICLRRILLLFLISAAFFPRSRNEDETITDTANTTTDDDDDETTTTDEDKTDFSTSTTTEPGIDASDQRFVNEPDPDETHLVHDPDNDNKICLALNFEGGFTISYPAKNGKKLTADEAAANIIGHEGTCNETQETHSITLRWPGYNFTLVVNKTSDKTWGLKSIDLTFNPQANFKDANDEPSLVTLSANDETLQLFTAPLDQSLTCTKKIKLYKEDGTPAADVAVSQFQLQAFDFGREFKPDTVCAEIVVKKKPPQSDTAPIAVGSTLAVLTLGVIVGYAVYRSLTNKKVDYGNIQG